MAVAPKDSNPFSHLLSGQTPESKLKDSNNNGSNQDGRPEVTGPHFDGYTTILKKHLDAVQGELSRLKGLQT